MSEYRYIPLGENVEEMFIGPFGSSLKNECFVEEDEAYCMVYEQKHAIQKTMDVETRYVNEQKYNELKRFNIQGGDIIVSCRGTIGETFIVPENAPLGIMHPSIMKIRLKDGVYDKYYFNLLLKSRLKKHEAEANGSGIKMAISATELGKESFPVPTMEEQREITDIISRISLVIGKRKQELIALDDLTKARFVELLGDMKPTVTIARYISELRGGKSLAGTEECKNKVLKTGAATFGWFDPDQYKYLPVDYEPLPEHKVETGDVIISRMNTPELVGACSYVFEAPDDMYYPDRLWKVIPKPETNPIFLWQLLWDREIRRQIKEKSGGTSGTMHNISKPKLLEIKCIDAPIALQNQFADFVKQVDKSKVAVQKALDETQLLFNSLMQQYFG